ncbi:hypothetical protein BaRGS_00029570 [Batillaria attramentaria]|uniref:Uncharacterized protein n=1 Tax=Batillaria attramentaria TaxID=370345 RepID=A0ABD0JVY2_9CAEN
MASYRPSGPTKRQKVTTDEKGFAAAKLKKLHDTVLKWGYFGAILSVDSDTSDYIIDGDIYPWHVADWLMDEQFE